MAELRGAHSPVGHRATAEILQIALDCSSPFYPGCMQLILSGLYELKRLPHPKLDHAIDLPTSHRRLFQDCMRFVTIKRTPEEIPQLIEKLAECRCASNEALAALSQTKAFLYLHNGARIGQSMSDREKLFEIVDVIVGIISGLLEKASKTGGKIYKVERNRRRDRRRGKLPAFPHKQDDVLPFGAHASLSALFNWYQWSHRGAAAGCRNIPKLVAVVISSFAGSVIPAVFSSLTLLDTIYSVVTTRSDRLKAAKQNQDDSYEVYSAITIFGALAMASPPLVLATWCLQGSRWMQTYMIETSVLSLSIGRYSERTKDAGGISHKKDVINIESAMHSLQLFHIHLAAGAWGNAKFAAASTALEHHPLLGPWGKSLGVEFLMGSPYVTIPWKMLNLSLRYELCYAPGCVRSFVSESHKFARCGGCMVVSYCSTRCQRAAFRHPAGPHKRVCGLLRYISDQFRWEEGGRRQIELPVLLRTAKLLEAGLTPKNCRSLLAYEEFIQASYIEAIGIGQL